MKTGEPFDFKREVARWEDFWTNIFGPKPDAINWLGPNAWVIGFLLICAAVSRIPVQASYGWFSDIRLISIITLALVMLLKRVFESFTRAVGGFEPRTPTAAKRANEQIKLIATLLNATAIGGVAVTALSEMLTKDFPDGTKIVLGLAFAYWLHGHARAILGHLKDEGPSASATIARP